MAFRDLFVRLGLKSREFTKGLQDASKHTKTLEKQTRTMGQSISIARQHWLAITAASAGFILTTKKVLKEFTKWESALVDMGKVTSESLSKIKTKIMDLPPVLGDSIDLVKGYYQVISAGVTEPKRAMELLTEAAKASKAAHLDQSETIKALTKLMAGYEGQIKNVSEASDLLFAIEKEGQTTVAELVPIMGSLAKLSHDLGIHQNEMGASLALVTQTAGTTTEAATQYQGILRALMKPTQILIDEFKKMGFEGAQAAIQQIGFTETLKRLKDQAGGSAEKMAAMFGRLEGLKGMSALAANEFQNLNDKVEVMKNKTGKAAEAWEDYKKTSAAAWDSLEASISKVTIAIGAGLAPAAKRLAYWLSEAAEYWTRLFEGPRTGVALGVEMLQDYNMRVKEIGEELILLKSELKKPDWVLEFEYGGTEEAIKQIHERAKALHAELAQVQAKIAFITQAQPPEEEILAPKMPEKPLPLLFDIDSLTGAYDVMYETIKNYSMSALELHMGILDAEAIARQKDLDAEKEYREQLYEVFYNAEQQRWELEQDAGAKRYANLIKQAQNEIKLEKQKTKLKQYEAKSQATFAINMANFLYTLGDRESKKLFLLLKAAEFAKAIVAAHAASALALANPPGPPATIPLAASVLAWGYANAAVLAATNIAAGMAGGGGGVSIGAGVGTVGTYPVSPATGLPEEPEEIKPTTTIIVEGDFYGDEEFLDRLAERISEAVENREVRLISSGVK